MQTMGEWTEGLIEFRPDIKFIKMSPSVLRTTKLSFQGLHFGGDKQINVLGSLSQDAASYQDQRFYCDSASVRQW
jgi:hypothetical protein